MSEMAEVGWGRVIRRIVHLCFGHPADYVKEITLGFRCRSCGAEWGRGDYP